jgi:uncharacterized integral membrane protein
MTYNVINKRGREGDFMQFWFVVSLLFSIIIAIFAALNSNVVTIRLFFATYELSQSIVIILSAVIGAVIAIFFGLFGRIKSAMKMRELNSEIKYYKSKNEELSSTIQKKDIELATLKGTAAQPESTASAEGKAPAPKA